MAKDVTVADTYWRSLTYFNIYRLIIAVVLFAGTQPVFEHLTPAILSGSARRLLTGVSGAYVLACLASLLALWRMRRNFNAQLSLQVLADVVAFSVFIYLGGGLRSGLGVMLLVTLAGAGLVGQGRLTIFYAALATLGVLSQEVVRGFVEGFEPADFLVAGILCLGFFGTAGSALLLARRLAANEELARRRGVALRHQMQVSELVISLMQDGVLVVAGDGLVQQSNPRARELLGGPADVGVPLASLAPQLDAAHAKWLLGSSQDAFEFRAPGSGRQVQVRFVRIADEDGDTLLFVEDAGRVREESQRIKLAALGRLTASIAHEIRNPLSAIRHANELLGESMRSPEDQRLIRIMADNTRRLEGIVSDILQIGRRDRAQRETLDLGAFVGGFLDQYTHSAAVPRALIRTAIQPGATLAFDRSHLHQILWNLVSNAVRHCRGGDGSVRLWSESGDGWCAVHLADDGPGVDGEQRPRIFEPFYTTDAKGTGLGLFIARELADANGARLDLLDNAPGAHFSLIGERNA